MKYFSTRAQNVLMFYRNVDEYQMYHVKWKKATQKCCILYGERISHPGLPKWC